MPPSQTCSACRYRKVRCDGVLPMCGPCSKARRPIECTYTSTTAVANTPKGEYLKKGAACAPCRRKKKKCDAKRPFCSTCKTVGKEKDCSYDENAEWTLTEALFLRTHILEQRLAAYEDQVAALSTQPLADNGLSATQADPANYSVASSSTTRLAPHVGTISSDGAPMYDLPQALHTLFDCISIPSPITDAHSISTPHISTGLEEFRSAYATHAPQYGGVLSPDKMQAVLAGDTSGFVVHPAFTYVAQLLGCVMWQMQRRTFIFLVTEHEQLQLLLGSLEGIDPTSEIQIRYLLSIYYFLKKRVEEGLDQLILAAAIVRRHNLAFPVTPDTFDPTQLSEATPSQMELISALAHLLYLDRESSFVFNVPTCLDKNFDEDLKNVSVYYPTLSKTCLTYLRARSLLLFFRVRELSVQWASINASIHSGIFNSARPEWFDAYWPLLEELTMHASNLEGEMLRMTFYGEREHSVALKFCLVVALSGKAQMHWLIHHDHLESAQRAMDVVMEVVNITRSFKDNEFLLLDPLLGVCWYTVARIIMEAMKQPLSADVIWDAALQTIDLSSRKLNYEVPYTEEVLRQVSDGVRIVELS